MAVSAISQNSGSAFPTTSSQCDGSVGPTDLTVPDPSRLGPAADTSRVNAAAITTRTGLETAPNALMQPLEGRQGLRQVLDEARPRTLVDVDVATISEAARNLRRAEEAAGADRAPGEPELSESEQQTVRELEARDREVRQHEQAHLAAAGDLAAGGATYTYQTGPDGKRYAIGGSVDIQLKTGRTPEETARNMERAQRAANAPASPSAPDRAVAALAAREAADARRKGRTEPGGLVDRSA